LIRAEMVALSLWASRLWWCPQNGRQPDSWPRRWPVASINDMADHERINR
jgi:hypothetical protein